MVTFLTRTDQIFTLSEILASKNQSYILTEEGRKSEKCKFLTLDEPSFTSILWKNQNDIFKSIETLSKF